MRIFGCARYKRLISEEMDRALTPRERNFLSRHGAVCNDCEDVQSQSSLALNMLRAATLEVEAAPMFEDRVMRKLKVQTTRESIRYWSPAVAGAFIAGLAIVAALQIITRSAQLPHVKLPGGEARKITLSKPLPFLDNGADHLPPR
jgi:hypothetical protein